MANVYTCVKAAENYLVNPDSHYITIILNLPKENKCDIFKDKLFDETKEILDNYRLYIAATVNEMFGSGNVIFKKSSNDNKIGADLICSCNEIEANIEVKFGNETNSAIGMRTFANIFETNMFTKMLNARTVRKTWHKMFINEGYNEELQLERLYLTQKDYAKLFNEQFEGKILSNDTVSFLEESVINNSGSSAYKCENYIKFGVNNNHYMVIDFQYFKGKIWKILPINIDNEKRINIKIKSDANEVITFVLNWKNDYNLKGHGKFASKLGLGSPSWNIKFTRSDDE